MNIARVAVIAAILLIPAAAGAGPREDLIDGMAKCGAVADNAARLSCYDALNPTVKAAQAEPPPPVAPAAAPAGEQSAWYDPFHVFGTSPKQQVRPEQFGAENLTAPPPPPPPPGQAPAAAPPAEPEALDSITAGVTDYSFNRYQKFLVVLDNGQIWQQLQSDGGLAHFARDEKNTITISRGFIGSYVLVINDSKLQYKVKRLK
jgi:hypothetical protein